MADDRGQMTENRRQMAEHDKDRSSEVSGSEPQMTEDRRQMAEHDKDRTSEVGGSEPQMTDDREQMTEHQSVRKAEPQKAEPQRVSVMARAPCLFKPLIQSHQLRMQSPCQPEIASIISG
jgi:hypothetical protein